MHSLAMWAFASHAHLAALTLLAGVQPAGAQELEELGIPPAAAAALRDALQPQEFELPGIPEIGGWL